jgi:hypothetical protein
MRVPLEPPPGLTDDDTTFARPGAWSNGSNIRFVKNKPEAIGSWSEAFGTLLTGICRNIKAWTVNNGSLCMAFGTHSALQVWWNGALSTITPAGLTAGSIDSSGTAPGYGTGTYGTGLFSTPTSISYARTWSLDTWGENLLANPRGGGLYQWQNDPAVLATVVTNAPTEITCMLVTPERQVLACGCNEEVSGDFNPLCIRACDLETLTDWTTTNLNNAFEHILEGEGRIVTARMVGPYVVVWTNVGIHVGQYIGAPGQAYRIDQVAEDCGLIGPNAVQVIGQTAYWIAPDRQFRVWSPGSEPMLAECAIHADFADHLDMAQVDKIVAAELSMFGEVWVFYPDTRDDTLSAGGEHENSRYLAVAKRPGTWFRGDLARTAFVDTGVTGYPLGADASGQVWYHEHPSGDAVAWSLEMGDTYIGLGDQVAEVQRFVPDFERQDQDLSLTVTTRKDPRSSRRTSGPHTITPTATRKDFRVAGRVLAIALEGSGRMRLGRPMFEFQMRGRR